jgi:hypothetical protein
MAASTRSASQTAWSVLAILLLVHIFCCRADDSDLAEQERTQKEYPQGIARLLFKHMRFRALPEVAEAEDEQADLPDYGLWSSRPSDRDLTSGGAQFYRGARHSAGNRYRKRQQQDLVNNLTALLAEASRGRKPASNLRMPSLRFG